MVAMTTNNQVNLVQVCSLNIEQSGLLKKLKKTRCDFGQFCKFERQIIHNLISNWKSISKIWWSVTKLSLFCQTVQQPLIWSLNKWNFSIIWSWIMIKIFWFATRISNYESERALGSILVSGNYFSPLQTRCGVEVRFGKFKFWQNLEFPSWHQSSELPAGWTLGYFT